MVGRLKQSFCEFLLKCSSVLGVPSRMFSRAIEKQDSNIFVLTYHNVTTEQFREHLHFLDRHFLFMDLDGLVSVLSTREFPPDLTVVVTFDDGLQSFYESASPVAFETGIPIANYVTSGVVDSHYWYDPELDRIFVPGHSSSAKDARDLLQSHDEAKRLGFVLQAGLTSEQLIELDNQQEITIGAHSVTHAMLVETEYDTCRSEILDSKKDLEGLLGHEVKHFAYPYGAFSERESSLVQEAGFKSAAGTQDTWVARESNPFCFPRKMAGPMGNSLQWLQYRIGK